jgi:hypothetical protein
VRRVTELLRWRRKAIVLLVTLSPFHPFTPSLCGQTDTTVGMSGRLGGVVLPGPELKGKEPSRESPVVLRVARVDPHGTAFRYELEYYALVPGRYDLRDHLVRAADGKPAVGLPSIVVTASPVLPPGQIEPNKLEIEPGPRVGGYRTLVIVVVVLWALGLAALIASFFFPRDQLKRAAAVRPISLAERLRPLVDGATRGKLSRAELADLERALLAYWRKRLELESTEPGAAVERLRAHEEAGPLLAQLESWLHRPGPAAPVDVAALLAPYRDLPADAIELTGGRP